MKMSVKSTAATLVLLFAGVGIANASLTQGQIDREILSSFDGSGNVSVSVKGNVATVSGWVEDASAQHKVLTAASKLEGVDSVKGFVTISN